MLFFYRYYSYYAYDHSGERRLKLTGDNNLLDVNADFMATYTLMSEPTLYPSAYMVLTNRGYTKHYYAGAERVAARLGGGGLDALHHVVGSDEEMQRKADVLFDQSFLQVNDRVLEENDQDCIMLNEFAREEFGHRIDGIPIRMKAKVKVDHSPFMGMVNSMLYDRHRGQENEVYFYHSDHLGSASWITDFSGVAVQHIQYLPYGEPYVNQHPFGYSERFTFTGKEKDVETGYNYHGARYYDAELLTSWTAVDPLADKYPGISPYHYCHWNPLRLIDPDGKDDWLLGTDGSLTWDKNTAGQRQDRIVYSDGTFVCVNKGVLEIDQVDGGRNYSGQENLHLDFGSDGNNATEVFEFLSDYVSLEYSMIGAASCLESPESSHFEIHGSMGQESDPSGAAAARAYADQGVLRYWAHNHPNGNIRNSNSTNKAGEGNDAQCAKDIQNRLKQAGSQTPCSFYTYTSNAGGRYRSYGNINKMERGSIVESNVRKNESYRIF